MSQSTRGEEVNIPLSNNFVLENCILTFFFKAEGGDMYWKLNYATFVFFKNVFFYAELAFSRYNFISLS